nr:MAG TPA: hypothetical protein [Caudoviricetes sp.]DAU00972.1 MAG TPA: hypothetical protein [Caudoviricetes sp.]
MWHYPTSNSLLSIFIAILYLFGHPQFLTRNIRCNKSTIL